MTVTLTETYKEFLKSETVDFIDELLEDNNDLGCMLEFIDENSEDDFLTYYEDYVEQGEKLGYNVVDAFVQENGLCDVEQCEDAYIGTYRSTGEFVQELVDEQGGVPDFVIVDFDETWERSLSFDYDAVDSNGGVHIFRRYY